MTNTVQGIIECSRINEKGLIFCKLGAKIFYGVAKIFWPTPFMKNAPKFGVKFEANVWSIKMGQTFGANFNIKMIT